MPNLTLKRWIHFFYGDLNTFNKRELFPDIPGYSLPNGFNQFMSNLHFITSNVVKLLVIYGVMDLIFGKVANWFKTNRYINQEPAA